MILILNLKKKYFEEIKNGIKVEEYRELNSYWTKRILNKPKDYFKEIVIKSGYPKIGDIEKEIHFPWNGYEIKKIKHEHFGNEEIEVIAIKLKK